MERTSLLRVNELWTRFMVHYRRDHRLNSIERSEQKPQNKMRRRMEQIIIIIIIISHTWMGRILNRWACAYANSRASLSCRLVHTKVKLFIIECTMLDASYAIGSKRLQRLCLSLYLQLCSAITENTSCPRSGLRRWFSCANRLRHTFALIHMWRSEENDEPWQLHSDSISPFSLSLTYRMFRLFLTASIPLPLCIIESSLSVETRLDEEKYYEIDVCRRRRWSAAWANSMICYTSHWNKILIDFPSSGHV